MKIGPRQGDEFTLPQAAGESCVDKREHAKLFRRVQISLELPQAQGGRFIFLGLRLRAEPPGRRPSDPRQEFPADCPGGRREQECCPGFRLLWPGEYEKISEKKFLI